MRIDWKLRALLCAVVLFSTVQPANATAAVTFGSSLVKAPDSICSSCAAVTLKNVAGIEQAGSPVNGTLTSARVKTRVEPGDGIFRILRPTGAPLEFLNLGQAPVAVTADGSPTGHITEVATNLPIAIGDRLAVAFPGQDMHYVASGAAALCAYHPEPPVQEVGTAVTYITGPCGAFEVLVSGTVEPDSSIALGKSKSLKNGKARLTVTVPNAGVVSVSDARSTAGGARAAKRGAQSLVRSSSSTTIAPGAVTLTLKPSKAGRRALARKGKVKVPITVSFTPSDGRASVRSSSLKLRQKR